jgi:hypothetical protein
MRNMSFRRRCRDSGARMRAVLDSKSTIMGGCILRSVFQTNNLEAPLSRPSLAISMQGRNCEGSSPSLSFGVFVIEVLVLLRTTGGA